MLLFIFFLTYTKIVFFNKKYIYHFFIITIHIFLKKYIYFFNLVIITKIFSFLMRLELSLINII